MKFRNCLLILLALLAVILLMPYAASAQQDDPDMDETETEETEEYMLDMELSWPFSKDIDYSWDNYLSRLEPDGMIRYENKDGDETFVSGDPYGSLIEDFEDAYNAGLYFMDNSDFDLEELRADSYGDIKVYTFQQVYDGWRLIDCYLKIITDSDGNIQGISSSLISYPDEDKFDRDGSPKQSEWDELFVDWDSEIYEKTVTAHSGEEVDISIPVLIDPEVGERYLGDKERLIFCVDASGLEDLDDWGDSIPINMDQDQYSDGVLLTYYRFIQVYDYFAEKGWLGPDGLHNPCMLQFEMTGAIKGNAFYGDFQDGFHTFAFSVDDGASQSLQVIAHEFMHGVSATNHIGRHRNETGALDEAVSDQIGNAVESDIRQWEQVDNKWMNGFLTSHRDEYQMFVWDEFFTPQADHPDDWNDYGDVHKNAAVINMLAWRMDEAGMTARDRFDYWFTFDLTLTPKTDFEETAARVGWSAEIAGLSDYAPVIQKAAEELGLNDTSLPKQFKEHQGMIVFRNPLNESNVKAEFCDPWRDSTFTTWPIAGTDTIAAVFKDGADYMISVKAVEDEDTAAFWNGIEDRWEFINSEKLNEYIESYDSDYCIRAVGGETVQIGD